MKRIIFFSVCLFIFGAAGLPSVDVIQDKNLPLTVVNPKRDIRTRPVAFIISGDRGWYSFEQTIADSLATMGVPTIGLNTKKYFWNHRTPEETASDIAASIIRYNRDWKRDKFVFIGYSLGAELLPFIINRLPEEIRTGVTMLVLLSPTATTDFQVHFSDMLGIESNHNTYKVTEEIDKIKTIPILLVFGEEEKTGVPAMLTGANVTLAIVPGDHTYNHDSFRIVKTMKDHNAF